MINVALPKGGWGEGLRGLCLRRVRLPRDFGENRRLTFENREKGVRYFWVKPPT